jgi:hypothetical protein
MSRSIIIPSLSTSEDDLRTAKREWSARLLGGAGASAFSAFAAASPAPADNVVGVAVGEKYQGKQPTGVLGLKFLVIRKYPEDQLTRRERLPKSVDGLPVDVEEVGVLRAHKTAIAAVKPVATPNPRTRMRPARPGASVGFISSQFKMAGTFGAVVTDDAGTYILSNNHVLADENALQPGAPIVQPGPLDGGTAKDVVARLTRFVPLTPGANRVDAAIAAVAQPGLVSRDILHIGAPSGAASASVDMAVHKFGRTTSYTAGRVTSVAADVKVEYGMGTLVFEDQILIQGSVGSFSAAGDSGSLILERGTNLGVGLLFAGSASHTIANHLNEVLQALAVELA